MKKDAFTTTRRILCVFPKYSPSFGTFEYAYPLTDGVQAFMPPQGLLLIAASVPENWDVRFVDENIHAASADDFRWADAVFVSGMHIQRRQINDICSRAHDHDRAVAPSDVGQIPEEFPPISAQRQRDREHDPAEEIQHVPRAGHRSPRGVGSAQHGPHDGRMVRSGGRHRYRLAFGNNSR